MLAAAPSRNNLLELIRLALTMVSSDQKNIPESLKQHVYVVLKQAIQLAEAPKQVTGEILPESIELAIEIRDEKNLTSDIDSLADFDNITPDLAYRLLQRMETHSVYQV